MNWGNEAKDFGDAFARASSGRWKSKSERQEQAMRLEMLQLQLDQARRSAADYPDEKAYTTRMRALEEQIRILQLKAAKEGDTEGEPGADPDFQKIEPMQLNERGGGGGGATPASYLPGGEAHDYLEQPGEAAKSYTSPVDGTFAGKHSNEFHAVRSGGKRQHSGVDLNAKNGAGVYAPIGGTVLSIGYDPGGYDHYVVIMGNDGYIQRIANHGAVRVHRGDDIRAGDLLGVVARGHVHWEIIPPNSPAYRVLAAGGRASTQSHRGQRYPTINPADFLDLKPGTPIRAGKPFHAYDGQLEASAGPYSKTAMAYADEPGPKTGAAAAAEAMATGSEMPPHPDSLVGSDGGEQLDEFNMRGTTGEPILKGQGYGAREGKGSGYLGNPEMPGGDYQEVRNKFEHDRSLARLKMGEEGRDTRNRIPAATDVFGPPGTVDRTGIPYYGRGGTDVLGQTGRTGRSVWDGLPFNVIEDRESRGRAYDAPVQEDRLTRGRAYDAPVQEDRLTRNRAPVATDVFGGTNRTGAPFDYGGGTNVLPGNPPGGGGSAAPPGGYGGGTDVFGGTDRTGSPPATGIPVKAVARQSVDDAEDFRRRTGRTGQPTPELPSGAPPAESVVDVPSPHLNPLRRGADVGSPGYGRTGYGGAGGTAGQRYGGRGLSKLTNEDRQAVMDLSVRFGISPADLMSVIGYETVGTYNPDIVSPTGYRGLIQFGPNEQKQYGYKRGMSFADQIRGPVANYLQDRGLKPGMGLPELYSIINAGSLTKEGLPRWGAHDSNGDLRYHITRITNDYMPGAQIFFKSYGATDYKTTRAIDPGTGRPVPTPRPRGAGVGGGNLESDSAAPAPTPPPVVPSPIWDPLNPNRTATTPSSLTAPSSGSPFESPVSPVTPISPVSPSLAYAFGNSPTGRTGASFNRLEVPQFMARGGVVRPVRRMAAGGLVQPYSDIAIATGRTGNPQTSGELPVTSKVTRAAIPSPTSSSPPARPAPAADEAPDMTSTDGPGILPEDDAIDAGTKVVADQSVKAWNGGTPPDPGSTDISGAAPGSDTGGGVGGPGSDVLVGSDDSGGAPVPTPDSGGGVPAPPADPGASIETGIPAPGAITWSELPRAQKGDPDLAKYITAAEEKVDPYHKMGESARHLAAIGRMYKLFADRGQTEAAERAARAFVNYLYSGYNQFAAISEAALEAGNTDDAVEAGVRAWNFIPSGQTVTYSKDPNGRGYLINITDARGRVVHNHMYTPSEIASKVLGMTPGTYWRQIVDAAGGTMPSDAYSKVKDLIDRGQKVPPELLHGLKPDEVAGLTAYENNRGVISDAEKNRAKSAASDAADAKYSVEVDKRDLTTAELNEMGPSARATAEAKIAARTTTTNKGAMAATVKAAVEEYQSNNGTVSPATTEALARVGGNEEFDAAVKRIEGTEAATTAKTKEGRESTLYNEGQDKLAKEKYQPKRKLEAGPEGEMAGRLQGLINNYDKTRLAGFSDTDKSDLTAVAVHIYEHNPNMTEEQALRFAYNAALPEANFVPRDEDTADKSNPNVVVYNRFGGGSDTREVRMDRTDWETLRNVKANVRSARTPAVAPPAETLPPGVTGPKGFAQPPTAPSAEKAPPYTYEGDPFLHPELRKRPGAAP